MDKKANDIKFVTLATFDNLWTAEVGKNRLLQEGFNVHIINSFVNYSFGPTLLEGYRLQVEQSQFLKALNIYKNSLSDS